MCIFKIAESKTSFLCCYRKIGVSSISILYFFPLHCSFNLHFFACYLISYTCVYLVQQQECLVRPVQSAPAVPLVIPLLLAFSLASSAALPPSCPDSTIF